MKFSIMIFILLSIFINIKATDYTPCKTFKRNEVDDALNVIGIKDSCEYADEHEISWSDKKACLFDASGNCIEQYRKCTDIEDEDDCEKFVPNGSSFNCILSDEICRSRTCEEITDTSKCSDLKPTNNKKICTYNQSTNKCEEVDNPNATSNGDSNGDSNGASKINYSIFIIFILFIFLIMN